MENEVYDLIVIGGGPAGIQASLIAGLVGKRAALIERSLYKIATYRAQIARDRPEILSGR